MEFGTNGTTGTNDRNHVRADGDNLKYNTCDNGKHIFEVNGSEKVRIDSSGRLLHNTTATGTANIIIDSQLGNGSALRFIGKSSNDGTELDFYADNNSTRLGYLEFNNVVTKLVSETGVPLTLHTSGSERMRIDSSGRVLVATDTARSNFYSSAADSSFQIERTQTNFLHATFTHNDNGTTGPYIGLAKQRSNSVGGNTIVQSNDQLGGISFFGSDGSNFIESARVQSFSDGTPGSNDMPGRLVFSVTADGASSPTERMRISANGTATFNNTLSANGGIEVVTTIDPALYVRKNGTGGNIIQGRNAGGAEVFKVQQNGDTYNANNVFTALSDIKLKENIVDAKSQWYDIKALRPVNYNFKAETGQETHTQLGLVAQEVELVSPGLVSESPDRDADGNDLGTVTKSVNYSVLYMKAVKALQEAMERIETLEQRLSDAGIA
jgi:hypothetical protein